MADRYNLYYTDAEGNEVQATDARVEEGGSWVQSSDYAALEVQNNELQSDNDAMSQRLEGTSDAAGDVEDIVQELKTAYGVTSKQDFNRMLSGTSERQYQALKALFDKVG